MQRLRQALASEEALESLVKDAIVKVLRERISV